MVYTTLSVFQHSLDVSICCYMETVPGERRSNLKDNPVLEAYNADGFKLVRRTLTTDQHLPVCDSCPYEPFAPKYKYCNELVTRLRGVVFKLGIEPE